MVPEAFVRRAKDIQAMQFTDTESAQAISMWVAGETGFPVNIHYAGDVAQLVQVFTFEGLKSLYVNDWVLLEDGKIKTAGHDEFCENHDRKEVR